MDFKWISNQQTEIEEDLGKSGWRVLTRPWMNGDLPWSSEGYDVDINPKYIHIY